MLACSSCAGRTEVFNECTEDCECRCHDEDDFDADELGIDPEEKYDA